MSFLFFFYFLFDYFGIIIKESQFKSACSNFPVWTIDLLMQMGWLCLQLVCE